MSVEQDAPLGGRQRTGDDVEERCLAGAVGADDGSHGSARHGEVDIRERRETSEPTREPLRLEDHDAALSALRFAIARLDIALNDSIAPARPFGRKMTDAMMIAPTSIG